MRSWFSVFLLKKVGKLSGIKLIHRMTPEAKTRELFNGKFWVEAVLDPKRWEHEVQHGCALLSVPAQGSTLVKINFKMVDEYIKGLERDLNLC